MTRYKLHICFALLFMATGFAFGAAQFSEGSVSVFLPPSLASPLSVNNIGAQAALQIASSILAPLGFQGGQLVSPNSRDAGQLAVFTRDVSVGSPTTCNVLARNGRLVFSFVESGFPHSSAATVQLCTELADAFRARFGAAVVAVQLQ